MKQKGFFIVVDGTDGSGKSEQTKLLVESIKKNGFNVEVADFPQYGKKSSGLVEEYLNGKYGTAKDVGPYRASIFYACDRYDKSFDIHKWRAEGKIVVSNRYVSANMGHQAGKIKDLKERDEFLRWLDNLEFNIFGIPRPDLNIFLNMPPAIGQQLVDKKGHRDYVGGVKRDIHEADLQHLKDAYDAYVYVSKKYDWLTVECAPNGKLRSIEEIHAEIWDKVKKYL